MEIEVPSIEQTRMVMATLAQLRAEEIGYDGTPCTLSPDPVLSWLITKHNILDEKIK